LWALVVPQGPKVEEQQATEVAVASECEAETTQDQDQGRPHRIS
jgi:hypothetical protein